MSMKRAALILLFSTLPLHAAETKIYSQDGKYLGKTGSTPYDAESITNPVGQYGSKVSADSINNPYGAYGPGVQVPAADGWTPKKAAPDVSPAFVVPRQAPAAPVSDVWSGDPYGPSNGAWKVKETTAPAATPAVTPAPANDSPGNIIDALDSIRKEEAAHGK